PRVMLFEALETVHQLSRRTGEPRAQYHVMLDRRHVGCRPAAAPRDRGDLVCRKPGDEPQRGEHLHMLFVDRRDLANRLLASFGEVKMQTELEILTERQLLARPGCGLAVTRDRSRLHRRRPTADSTLDAMLDHEVEPARVGADNRLPGLDRKMDRARHQRQLFERIAAIRDLRRQGVVLAVMEK